MNTNSTFVAVPEKNGMVAEKFGKSQRFVICEIKNHDVVSMTYVRTSTSCEGKKQFVDFLNHHNINVLIVSAIGEHAMQELTKAGIRVIRGASGPIDKILVKYISGDLKDVPVKCDGPGPHNSGEKL